MREWIAIGLSVIVMVAGGVYTAGYQAAEIKSNKTANTKLQTKYDALNDTYSQYVADHKDEHTELNLNVVDKLNNILIQVSTTKVEMDHIKTNVKEMRYDMKMMKKGLQF